MLTPKFAWTKAVGYFFYFLIQSSQNPDCGSKANDDPISNEAVVAQRRNDFFFLGENIFLCWAEMLLQVESKSSFSTCNLKRCCCTMTIEQWKKQDLNLKHFVKISNRLPMSYCSLKAGDFFSVFLGWQNENNINTVLLDHTNEILGSVFNTVVM